MQPANRPGAPAQVVRIQGGEAVTPESKPLPQHAVEGAQKTVGAVKLIDQALLGLQTPTGASALGMKNMAPGAPGRALINALDPQGVDMRALVANIGSAEVKDRSGATVTIGEEPRLMPFIPVPTDPAPVAEKKLRQLRSRLASDYDVLDQFYPGVKQRGGQLPQPPSNKPGSSNQTGKVLRFDAQGNPLP